MCIRDSKNAARGPREYFTAVCAACGGEAKVPFEPKSDRPVYCSECFAKMRDTRLLICERRDGEAISRPIELYKMLRQVFAVQRVGPDVYKRQPQTGQAVGTS